ncbi:MAG: DUF2202 domain-containing protein [Chloroflexota bacterium]
MSNKLFSNGLMLLAVVGLLLAASGFVGITQVFAADLERGGPGNPGGPGGSGNSSGTRLTPLSTAEVDALKQAILEEIKAQNLYQSVINQFGSVYPFSYIVRAETQHISALERQASKYNITVPTAPVPGKSSYSTLQDACEAGVDAEKADAALYDILKKVTTHTDILSVYNNLQSASLNNHLPIFQACQ